jgi:hypothetical protein
MKAAESMLWRLAVMRPWVAVDGGLHAFEGSGDLPASVALHRDGAAGWADLPSNSLC